MFPTADEGMQWLVLLYQFPKGPGSLRVKIWRRLQSIGAVAIKNSTYVLPLSDQSREDFQWLLHELTAGGAEGAILEARLIDGMSDPQVKELFVAARDQEYVELVQELQAFDSSAAGGALATDDTAAARQLLAKARKKLAEIKASDYFGAARRQQAEQALRDLAARVATPAAAAPPPGQARLRVSSPQLKDRIWVTRQHVGVDRIACAWLIRRRIDPAAKFKFTSADNYRPADDELRFDMFEAEFTHTGDRCTLEVLVDTIGADDPALQRVAEVVHDIDLKDDKFQHPETQGIAHLLEGLSASTEDDDLRLDRGGAIFDHLYAYYQERGV